jgi:quercetin dioxygenase-like cupin family protein
VVILGSSPSGHAGEMHMPGVERKVLKEVESNIPGYANIRIRDVIFQPGASTPVMTMDNDIVGETTEGTLEATKDGQPFTAPKGTVWTYRKGGTEMTTNQGSTVAIMHVIDLLPA